MRVFLIRHPQPLIEPGVCYGRLDVDADEEHLRASSERLAARLAREVLTGPFAAHAAPTDPTGPAGLSSPIDPADAPVGAAEAANCSSSNDTRFAAHAAATSPRLRIVASPARRCRGLADALAETLGLDAHYDARLLEKDFGDWEGRRWDDIDPQLIDAWAADLMHFVPPGGESVGELAARALDCAADLGLPASDTLPPTFMATSATPCHETRSFAADAAPTKNAHGTGLSWECRKARIKDRPRCCLTSTQGASGASCTPAADDTLVLVTHAGIIRILLGHWLDLPLAEWSTLKLDFGALTRVDFVGASSAPALGSGAGKYGAVLHTLNG